MRLRNHHERYWNGAAIAERVAHVQPDDVGDAHADSVHLLFGLQVLHGLRHAVAVTVVVVDAIEVLHRVHHADVVTHAIFLCDLVLYANIQCHTLPDAVVYGHDDAHTVVHRHDDGHTVDVVFHDSEPDDYSLADLHIVSVDVAQRHTIPQWVDHGDCVFLRLRLEKCLCDPDDLVHVVHHLDADADSVNE